MNEAGDILVVGTSFTQPFRNNHKGEVKVFKWDGTWSQMGATFFASESAPILDRKSRSTIAVTGSFLSRTESQVSECPLSLLFSKFNRLYL